MARRIIAAVFACGTLAVAACSQPEVAPAVHEQPVFDKQGNFGCTDDDGRVVFVPGTATVPDYLPPCDELCDDGYLYDAAGNLIDECLPPPAERRPDRDGSDSGRTPNSTPGAGPTRG